MRPDEDREDFELEIPTDLVERKRREKKDHSRDKAKSDELERKSRTNHKRRLQEILEEDLDEEEEEYRHLWK